MGFDKAALPFFGVPLWLRQVSLLQELEPAQLFISGPAHGPWAGNGFRVIEDVEPGLGPLGGIASVLPRTLTSRLLVLGIDLPRIPVAFLEELLSLGAVVPSRAQGADAPRWEPLAAIYPVAPLAVAIGRGHRGDLSIRRAISALVADGHLGQRWIRPDEESWFANINTPGDAARAAAGRARS